MIKLNEEIMKSWSNESATFHRCHEQFAAVNPLRSAWRNGQHCSADGKTRRSQCLCRGNRDERSKVKPHAVSTSGTPVTSSSHVWVGN